MQTRAKFKCVSVAKREGYNGAKFVYEAEFLAVYGGSEENKQFFLATPSGQIKLGTVREDHFEVGREYYIDFVPCEG